MANKVIDPVPIIKNLADRCMKAKGLECSVLGSVIDMLKAAPAVHNAPYWATEEAYKNGYEAGKKEAVEVVRCKDCKHREHVWCPMELVEQYPWLSTKDDDFCSYGERKDNGAV